jgi:hypothetical protein
MQSQSLEELNVGDTCFIAFIQELIRDHNYSLKEFKNTNEDFNKMITTQLLPRSLLKFGELYMFRLDKETALKFYRNNCLILPFLKQFCDSPDSMDFSHVEEELLLRNQEVNMKIFETGEAEPVHEFKPILFLAGFSRFNYCRVISAAIVKFPFNPITKKTEAKLETFCSFQPNVNALSKYFMSRNTPGQLPDYFKLKKPRVDYKIDAFEMSDLKKVIQENALIWTKARLGQLLFLYIFRYLRADYPKLFNLRLQCTKELIPYYLSLGFTMGPSPIFTYKKPLFDKVVGKYRKDIKLASNFGIKEYYKEVEDARKERYPNLSYLYFKSFVSCTTFNDMFNMHISISDPLSLLQNLPLNKDLIVGIMNIKEVFDVLDHPKFNDDYDNIDLNYEILFSKDDEKKDEYKCFDLMFENSLEIKEKINSFQKNLLQKYSKEYKDNKSALFNFP